MNFSYKESRLKNLFGGWRVFGERARVNVFFFTKNPNRK